MDDQRNKIIDQEYEWLFTALLNSLNRIHKTQFEEAFWRKIYYFGLKRFVGIAYNHYYNFNIKRQNTDEKKIQNHKLTVAADFERLWYCLRDTEIYSEIASQISQSSNAKIILNKYDISCEKYETKTPRLLKSLFFCISKWPAIYFANTITVGCYFSARVHFTLWLKSLGKIAPYKIKRYIGIGQKIDVNKRILLNKYLSENLALNLENNNFRSFLVNFISVILPTLYLESFDDACAFYKKQVLGFKRVKLVLSESWFSDSQISFFIAVMHEYNHQFYAIDHNGPVVYFKNNTLPDVYKIVDRLYTQGWDPSNTYLKNKFIQSSSVHFGYRAAQKLSKMPLGAEILYFVAPAYCKRALESDMYFFQGPGALHYLENQRKYLIALNKNLLRSIIYRTAPIVLEKPYAFYSNLEFLQANLVNIDNFKQKNGVKVLELTKLAVYDYLATGYFESFISGRPTIVIADRQRISFAQEYINLIEELYELKIFICDPNSAATHVNKIANNPGEWWESENRRGKAIKFAETFVDCSDKLINQLLDTSKSLISS